MIGQFGCSVLPPSDAEGMLAIESECKNISSWSEMLLTHSGEYFTLRIFISLLLLSSRVISLLGLVHIEVYAIRYSLYDLLSATDDIQVM